MLSLRGEDVCKNILSKCLHCLIEDSAKSAPLENLLFLPGHVGILHSSVWNERLPVLFTQRQSKRGSRQSLQQIGAMRALRHGPVQRLRRGGGGLCVAWDSSHAYVCLPSSPLMGRFVTQIYGGLCYLTSNSAPACPYSRPPPLLYIQTHSAWSWMGRVGRGEEGREERPKCCSLLSADQASACLVMCCHWPIRKSRSNRRREWPLAAPF